jgi:hypothetical protein
LPLKKKKLFFGLGDMMKADESDKSLDLVMKINIFSQNWTERINLTNKSIVKELK